MELLFRIADTFTDSLAKLTAEDQKRAKTTAFDLQMNPKNQRLNFHRLDRIKGKDFWSVRVSDDIRIIVHQTDESMLLCYVDHHDKAYSWAERRKLETHPKTGAAQLVEIRQEVQVVLVPKYVEVETPAPEKPRPFASMTEDDLLAYGVPPEWLDDVRQATEDSILELASHLPAEASEALLNLATGTVPAKPQVAADIDPFEHPDAQRRFRVMYDVEELELALEYPWEKWMVFLHPAQREGDALRSRTRPDGARPEGMMSGPHGGEELAAIIVDFLKQPNAFCFSGAGVGVQAGLPDWYQLMDHLVDVAAKHDPTIVPGVILQALSAPFSRDRYDSDRLRALVSLPFTGLVTTNYDRSLHDAWVAIHQKMPDVA